MSFPTIFSILPIALAAPGITAAGLSSCSQVVTFILMASRAMRRTNSELRAHSWGRKVEPDTRFLAIDNMLDRASSLSSSFLLTTAAVTEKVSQMYSVLLMAEPEEVASAPKTAAFLNAASVSVSSPESNQASTCSAIAPASILISG